MRKTWLVRGGIGTLALAALAACGETAVVGPPDPGPGLDPVGDVTPAPPETRDVPPVDVPPPPVPPAPPVTSTATTPFWETAIEDAPSLPDVGDACLRLAPPPAAPNLHVVAIYEPYRDMLDERGRVPRPVSVRVTGTSPVDLVLTNYEPTTWNVTLAPGASVASVTVDAFHAAETTVTGLAGVPVAVRSSLRAVAGWPRGLNNRTPSFPSYLADVRSEHGGLEATFQAAYAGTSFVVGGAAGAPSATVGKGASGYDTRVACTDACSVPAKPLAWNVLAAGAITKTADARGVTFQGSGGGVFFASSRGARCGKHYFEVDTTVEARVGVGPMVESGPGPIDPGYAAVETVPAGARVGVAYDLETREVRLAWRTAAGDVVRAGPIAYDLWYREEVGPVAQVRGPTSGTVRLVPAAEHVFVPPAGYVADF